MAKRRSALVKRTWNLLRLALVWARKGGAFKRGLFVDLRFLPNFLKSLKSSHTDRIHYGEREFSFDETPAFHFKMRRPSSMRLPRIPCINPPVDFDDDNVSIFYERDEREEDCVGEGDGDDGLDCRVSCQMVEEEGGIDLKAEEFIAKFYEQMKLQRQVSLLQYNEMLIRGMS